MQKQGLRHHDVEERLQFEMMLADLSAQFINLPADQVDREILSAQRRVCEFLGLDLCSLWQQTGEDLLFSTLTHFYGDLPEMPPEPMPAKEFFPWIQQEILSGRVVRISSMDDLPPEAARDQETFRHFGLKSDLSLPLSAGNEPPLRRRVLQLHAGGTRLAG